MRFPLTRRAVLAGATLGAVVLVGSPPAAAATGTGSITGHLTTASGAAAANARVDLYAEKPFETREYVSSTRADGGGNYRFGNLGTGSYFLGFAPEGGPEQYHLHKRSLSDADGIAVVNGTATRVDEQLLAGGTIVGQIKDAAGAPVPALSIFARQMETGDSAYGFTDDDGRYRISALPGRYVVSFTPVPGSYQDQYVPGQIDEAAATVFEVRPNEEVVADDTALGTGSLSGRLTAPNGAPLAGAYVRAEPGYETTTADDNGEFTLPTLLAGAYRVSFEHGDRYQYYRGKLDYEHADQVVVTANQDARIADSLLPTGSVRVLAVDADTGAPVANFCADGECSNGTGAVILSGLPEGSRQQFYVRTEDGSYFPQETPFVEVQANKTVDVTVRLRLAGRITTTVVDRATGAPLADVCVFALTVRNPHLPDGYGDCTDGAGRMTIGPLEAGSYNLFADPGWSDPPSGYGRQWVGASGGTGDQRAVVTVLVKAGTTVAGPRVLLDRAGTISGRVTDKATGAPVVDARVSLLSYHAGSGPPEDITTDANGRYQITELGPYEWPLLFLGYDDYPDQWSGGVASRYEATRIKVPAGGTATYDIGLRKDSVTVDGTITSRAGEPLGNGFVQAHNAGTGDVAGTVWVNADGRYRFPVLPSQPVYFSYEVGDAEGRYYRSEYVPQPAPRRDGRAAPAGGDAAAGGNATVTPGAPTPTEIASTPPSEPARLVPPRRSLPPGAPAPSATVTLAPTAPPTAAASPAGTPTAPATTGTAAATGSAPRRPTPPSAGVYLVPASGTLTVEIVVPTD
ncbi:carboxypeptidase regulatory-like domain-containing protein [Micromonospora sp. NPDC049559]|uniref:carboxypeptidase regulatory-like domain-containing protein n=1 Tax=Micromonospora sp. NPDC049559 TaxID=3155923 RepID=UPI003431A03E